MKEMKNVNRSFSGVNNKEPIYVSKIVIVSCQTIGIRISGDPLLPGKIKNYIFKLGTNYRMNLSNFNNF